MNKMAPFSVVADADRVEIAAELRNIFFVCVHFVVLVSTFRGLRTCNIFKVRQNHNTNILISSHHTPSRVGR